MVYAIQLVKCKKMISKICLCPLPSQQSKGSFTMKWINGKKKSATYNT